MRLTVLAIALILISCTAQVMGHTRCKSPDATAMLDHGDLRHPLAAGTAGGSLRR